MLQIRIYSAQSCYLCAASRVDLENKSQFPMLVSSHQYLLTFLDLFAQHQRGRVEVKVSRISRLKGTLTFDV